MAKRSALLVSGLFVAGLSTCLSACLSDLNTDEDAVMTDASPNGGDASDNSGADANSSASGASGNANGAGTSTNGTSAGANGNGTTTNGGNTANGANTGNGTTTSGSGGNTANGTTSNGGTTNGGTTNGGTTGQDAAVPSGTPVFVAAGYGGRRVRSTDLGMNWTEITDEYRQGGGDDQWALRAISYGHGLFIAVGLNILTSADGVSWNAQKNPQAQWIGGIQIAPSGRFVATGGYGYSAYSDDAINWKVGGLVGANAPSRSLAFGNGMFVTATDGGIWWSSSNGLSWTEFSSGHDDKAVAFCDGAFKAFDTCTSNYVGKRRAQGAGVTIRTTDAGNLERSTDGGKTFGAVLSDGLDLLDVVFGYAP